MADGDVDERHEHDGDGRVTDPVGAIVPAPVPDADGGAIVPAAEEGVIVTVAERRVQVRSCWALATTFDRSGLSYPAQLTRHAGGHGGTVEIVSRRLANSLEILALLYDSTEGSAAVTFAWGQSAESATPTTTATVHSDAVPARQRRLEAARSEKGLRVESGALLASLPLAEKKKKQRRRRKKQASVSWEVAVTRVETWPGLVDGRML